jgi:hypothetical protein
MLGTVQRAGSGKQTDQQKYAAAKRSELQYNIIEKSMCKKG